MMQYASTVGYPPSDSLASYCSYILCRRRRRRDSKKAV